MTFPIEKMSDDTVFGLTARMFYKMPFNAGFLSERISDIVDEDEEGDQNRLTIFNDLENFINRYIVYVQIYI